MRWWSGLAASGELIETLAFQLAAVAALSLSAWGIRVATGPWTDRLAKSATTHLRIRRIPAELHRLIAFLYAWLLLVLAGAVGKRLGVQTPLIGITASLTGLWIVLRPFGAVFEGRPACARRRDCGMVTAALAILGLLSPTVAALDSLAITIGNVRLSVLLGIKAALVVAILLWAALGLARLIRVRIQHVAGLSPSVQVLAGNLIKIELVSVALLIGINIVGIDLTALTVFSGAVGVGVGLGLQKIVSNFISGIILLLERSIKPGD